MKYALIAALVVGTLPLMAEAGHREYRSSRDSRWSVSIGIGSGYGHRGDYIDTRITYSKGYDYSYRAPRYHYRETYYAPPVVYRPAPVYVAPPPVVHYPAPVYRYEPCYPTGYTYYRSTYYYRW